MAVNSELPSGEAGTEPGILGILGKQPAARHQPRYIDIGINLADPIFRGRHHGKQRHPDDLHAVVQRAKDVGCKKLIVTGSSFRSSRDALKLTEEFPKTVYSTAGIHPCSSAIFGASHPHHHEVEDEEHTAACDPDPTKPVDHSGGQEADQEKSDRIIADLRSFIKGAGPGLVALGEFGLDYDRLHYCPRRLQLHSFERQLDLVVSLQAEATVGGGRILPLFLHSRAAHRDLVGLLKAKFGDDLKGLRKGGVVHSFTGTVEELRELMDLGLYIGINGCSFKTAENCAVVKEVRFDRMMIETDGPWCEVRPSHEGWKYLVEDAKRQAEASARADAEAQVNGQAASSAVPDSNNADGTPASAGKQQLKKQQRQQQQQQGKKGAPKKAAAEVHERFKSVKKEKWEEGAMVKSRNEPCMIERVAKIVAGIKGVPLEVVCDAAWANTVKVFGLDEIESTK